MMAKWPIYGLLIKLLCGFTVLIIVFKNKYADARGYSYRVMQVWHQSMQT